MGLRPSNAYYSIDTCSPRPQREEHIVELFYLKRIRNSASGQDISHRTILCRSRPTDTAVQPCVGPWSLIGCPTSTPSHQQPPEATNKAAPRGSAACDSPLVAPAPDYGSCGYPAPVCCYCPTVAAPLLPPSPFPLLYDGENHQSRARSFVETCENPVLT